MGNEKYLVIFKKNLGGCSLLDTTITLLSTLRPGTQIQVIGDNAVLVEGPLDENKLQESVHRSSTVKYIVRVTSVEDISECLDASVGTGARVTSPKKTANVEVVISGGKKRLDKDSAVRCLNKSASALASRPGESSPQSGKRYCLLVDVSGKRAYFGEVVREVRRDRLIYRGADKRVYTQFSALPVKIALFLVNLSSYLSGRRDKRVALNPFCGTGSLLIEAALQGFYAVGLEIHYKPIRGARRNLIQFNLYENADLVLCDALLPPIRNRSADIIVFDPPYGKMAPAKGGKPSQILRSFLEKVDALLAEGGVCLFTYPPPLTVDGLKVIELCRTTGQKPLRAVWCAGNECQGNVLGH